MAQDLNPIRQNQPNNRGEASKSSHTHTQRGPRPVQPRGWACAGDHLSREILKPSDVVQFHSRPPQPNPVRLVNKFTLNVSSRHPVWERNEC